MINSKVISMSHIRNLSVFLALIFLATIPAFSQSKIVLNGAKINLQNGANLVIANPATNAITRNSGHIISEGENNVVKWLTGNTTGTYIIPFGFGNSEYLPVSFTKTAGTGNGYFSFATYGTNWQNSALLPAGVTNLTGPNGDNSTMVIDRFWKIEPVNYTTKPDLTNLSFSYSGSEIATPNTITEGMLAVQRWNDQTQSWSGFAATGEVDLTQKTVKISSVSGNELFKWWTLTDRNSPLPLELISFEATKNGNAVKLNWLTAQEINCQDFEIQRSSDALNFITIGKQNATGSQLNSYTYLDNAPLTGTSYYRLKQNDLDGKFTYSPIRSVLMEGNIKVSTYPNPTSDHKFSLLMGDAPMGDYNIIISDIKGGQDYVKTLNIDQKIVPVILPETMKAGIYLVTLQSPKFITQFKISVN